MAEELKAPGQTAYEVYSARMDGKNEAGLPMPRWDDVWIGHKEAWASVESVCQRLPAPPEIEPPSAEDVPDPSPPAPSSGEETGQTTDDPSTASSTYPSRRRS